MDDIVEILGSSKQKDDYESIKVKYADRKRLWDRWETFNNCDKLSENFVFKKPINYQPQILQAIQACLLDDTKKYIFVEAPTGSGKSALVMTCAKAAGSANVITVNKNLQDQYLNDFSFLTELKGRSNYKCRLKPYNCGNSPCVEAPEDSSIKCTLECGYSKQKTMASYEPFICFNIHSYIHRKDQVETAAAYRRLLMIDEAHNLIGGITDAYTVSIDVEFIINFLNVLRDSGRKKELLDGNEHLKPFSLEEWSKILSGLYEELSNLPEEELKKLSKNHSIKSEADNIHMLINNKENYEMTENKSYPGNKITSVTMSPVDISNLATGFFGASKKVLMFSATILDPDMMMKVLGLPQEECSVIRVKKSTFPKENRPIYTNKLVGSITKKTMDDVLPKIIEGCRSILEEHGDVKGIIHGHSYALCNAINNGLQSPRILYPSRAAEQQQILRQHFSTDEPTVLLSPSMIEGLDLKGDKSRFQIMVKVPYPYLGDSLIKRRMNIYNGFYEYLTALSMAQAYGRSVRGESDWAYTYMLDSNFLRFVRMNTRILPEWFLEAFPEGVI